MREVKKPEERRADIIAMSEKLFSEKGYLHTTTQDIISGLKISRGLLYYHFKSKEDILWCIAEKHATPVFRKLQMVIDNNRLTAIEKVVKFLEATVTIDPNDKNISEEEVAIMESLSDAMQLPENTFMMDSINHKIAYKTTELFLEVIYQGIEEDTFNVCYPESLSAYLMTGFTFVMNDPFYHKNSDEEAMKYFESFKHLLNQVLGTEKPIF